MDVISTVSQQWATRPDDQRFVSLADLYAAVNERKRASAVLDVALDHVQVGATDAGAVVVGDERGTHGELTHWAFGQLCHRAKAPAGYLRSLPAELARINLQWSLEMAADREDGRFLVRRDRLSDAPSVAAVTSSSYGRIWDADVVGSIMTNVGPDWKVPAASYAAKDPKKATTLYASDRDVFLFLVDESRPVEVDGETLFRGFYCWNSETGSATFGLATFLYRYVCDNRNIWGPKGFREFKIRHTSGGPHRFMWRAVPQLKAYANATTTETVNVVRSARAREVGKDKAAVTDWLRARGFTRAVATKAYESAEAEPGLNPRSLWGVVQGLTHAAHDIKHTDARTDLETKAGALLDLVA
jgi:hypothetical protein